MSTSPNQPRDLLATNSILPTDLLIVQTNPTQNSKTKVLKITFENLMGNSAVLKEFTPANSTANCVKGQACFDSSYLYIAVANNQFKRIALVSF
jgi:hypothetical protein